MTADHPTREERYAAVLHTMAVEDNPGHADWTDCATTGPCRDEGRRFAALVAADPAPAQRDAAWPCDNHGEPNTCLSLRKAEAECCRVCRIRAADRILHAAQPDAALSDVEQQVIAVLRSFWTHETPETLRPVAKALLAARAAQPVPAPEVQHLPGCQQFPTGWLCVAACTTVWKDNPAPEVSRGVAEAWPYGDVSAAVFVAAASWPWERQENRDGWAPKMLTDAALADREIARARRNLDAAAQHVRDAPPADDGADCCRERTTAGGCGCGRSGEGASS